MCVPNSWVVWCAPRLARVGWWAAVLSCMAVGLASAQPAPALPGPEAVTRVWSDPRFQRLAIEAAAAPAVLTTAVLPEPVARDAQALLRQPGTVALLLIDGGRIVFEGYDKGATEADRLLSFSMAKTLTALAVGEALCAGRLASLEGPAVAHAPQLAGTAFAEVSLRDLLRMSSGARSSAGQLHGQPRPGATADLIFGRTSATRLISEHGQRARTLFGELRPGERFAYNNLDTDALALVLEGATGEPFARWFGRTVMARVQPEAASFWLADAEGRAVAHMGFMATLRDWGRIAQRTLDLRTGRTGDACLQRFVSEATRRQIVTGPSGAFAGYGYQTWTDHRLLPSTSFWMQGFGGQRIGIDPESGKILVTFAWQPEDGAFQLFRNWVGR